MTVSVRINAPRTPWCHLDVLALAAAPGPLRSIVVPKVRTREIWRSSSVCSTAPKRPAPGGPRCRLQALIETAAGFARIEAIAAASPRLESLIIGYADLAASLGRSDAGAADLHAWDGIRDRLLIAARAYGLQAIDGPYLGIQADAEFSAGASWARELGFDGKWAIHPSQVAPLIELFQPSPEEIARAREIIEALDAAERRAGEGAVAFEEQMLDEAVPPGRLPYAGPRGLTPRAADGLQRGGRRRHRRRGGTVLRGPPCRPARARRARSDAHERPHGAPPGDPR